MAFELVENDTYYYDSNAAERPIKFIEKYLTLYEDEFAGKPMRLLDWQKTIIRDVFGWKRRSTKTRRFKVIYCEIGKGNGKSAFATALGAYLLFADGAQGAQVYSVAKDKKQAELTFKAAKKIIAQNAKLTKQADDGDGIKQFSIEVPSTNSEWYLISGDDDSKQGIKPTCILFDELHEQQRRGLWDALESGLMKRANSLMVAITNAGTNKESICWELHERAKRVISGESKDESLYPAIFSADSKADWTDEAVWAAANPSLGYTISLEDLRVEFIKAKENPAKELMFRRLYLGHWLQSADKWIDMQLWDKCAVASTRTKEDKREWFKTVKDLPLYLGADLSKSDDLSSIAAVWVGEKKLYVRVWMYLPRKSAQRMEQRESLPFAEWASDGHVNLLKSITVDDDAHKRFERLILNLKKRYKLQSFAYDRYCANALVSRLEHKHQIVCIAVRQWFDKMGPPTEHLDSRIKAGTIVLPNNPCLRWQAANVEVMADKFGSIRPIKEAAKGRYAGRRTAKIDGIVSIIIALSEVLEHAARGDEANALANWDGKIVFF